MDIASFVLTLCAVGLLGWVVYSMRAARKDVRSAKEGVEAILAALRKGHGDPCPSATAVVTERAPSGGAAPAPVETAPSPEPAPAARSALPSTGTMLQRMANLTPEDIARIQALAAKHGVSDEDMLRVAFAWGSKTLTANDARAAAPTPTPPESPPSEDTPPSGKRRS